MSALIINDADNVAVALKTIAAGEKVLPPGGSSFNVLEEIPYTHKVALRDIASGEPVVKYGEIIALASDDIKQGQWVHVHNVKSARQAKEEK